MVQADQHPTADLDRVDMTSLYGRHGYPAMAGSRDLRFDFMRGFAVLSVVAAHLEFFSWFNFLFWERLGLISAAGMFVVTAGLVLGLVSRKVVEREGMPDTRPIEDPAERSKIMLAKQGASTHTVRLG